MKEPKEKAQELVGKFVKYAHADFSEELGYDGYSLQNNAKQCALICCEAVLSTLSMYTGELNPEWKFWNEVKTEIQKL